MKHCTMNALKGYISLNKGISTWSVCEASRFHLVSGSSSCNVLSLGMTNVSDLKLTAVTSRLSHHVIKFILLGCFMSACTHDDIIPERISSEQPLLDAAYSANDLHTSQARDLNKLKTAQQRTTSKPTGNFLIALTESFEHGRTITPALMNIEAKSGRLSDQQGFLQPTFSAAAKSYGNGLTIQGEQPLFEFGKRAARIANERAELDDAYLQLAHTRNQLLSEMLDATLKAKHANARIALLDQKIRDLTDTHKTAKELAVLGVLSDVDVRAAEVELRTAQVALLEARSNIQQARNLWDAKSVVAVDMPLELDVNELRRATDTGSIADAIDTAQTQSLEIRSLQASIVALEADALTLQRSNRPTISASLQTTVGGEVDDSDAGFSLSYPVFARAARDDLKEVRSVIASHGAELISERREIETQMQRLDTIEGHASNLAGQQRETLSLLRARANDLAQQVETGLATFSELIDAKIRIYDMQFAILGHQNQANEASADILILSGALLP